MGYARRTPEETALHKLAQENIWDFFREALEQTGKRFPAFIIEAWRRFLNCDVLPHVPMRQYVLSLPFELWHILGFQTGLMNRVQLATGFPSGVTTWTS